MKDLRLMALSSALLLAALVSRAAAAEGEPQEMHVAARPTVTLHVPVFSDDFTNVPVAKVGDDVITMKELGRALESSHQAMAAGKPGPKINPVDLVNRLINAHLFVREAHTIGLDELPEVKDEMASFGETTLRRLILLELTKDAKADPAEAEKLFQDDVREYKLRSVMFPKEEDAVQMEADLKAGRSFEDLAAQAVKDDKAKGGGEGAYFKPKDLQPEIAEAAGKLAAAQVSEPVKTVFNRSQVYVLLKLEEVRYPEDPKAREEAERRAQAEARARVFKAVKEKMVKADVKFKKKIIDGLDFEAKPASVEALKKDKRVIVEVRGGRPITVAELAGKLAESFYHGAETAAKDKKMNRKKTEILDQIVEKRLLDAYNRKAGLDKTDRYRELVKEHEVSVLFTAFLNKAVVPDVKITDDDMKAYYDQNAKEFSYPEMIRLRSIAFEKTAQAEDALEKLQKGADFNWTRANSEGRLDEVEKGLLAFDGKPLLITAVPTEIREVLSGAKAGDLRTASEKDVAYVLLVDERIPAQGRPLDEVKDGIRQKLFGTKLQQAVETWASKLRAATPVETYVAEGARQDSK